MATESSNYECAIEVSEAVRNLADEVERLTKCMREIRDLVFFHEFRSVPKQTFWLEFQHALRQRNYAEAKELPLAEGGETNG